MKLTDCSSTPSLQCCSMTGLLSGDMPMLLPDADLGRSILDNCAWAGGGDRASVVTAKRSVSSAVGVGSMFGEGRPWGGEPLAVRRATAGWTRPGGVKKPEIPEFAGETGLFGASSSTSFSAAEELAGGSTAGATALGVFPGAASVSSKSGAGMAFA